MRKRAIAKQQRGLYKAYGNSANKSRNNVSATRNYVSATRNHVSATRNYYKVHTPSYDSRQRVPEIRVKRDTNNIEREFMIYTSINTVSLLLTDNAVYQKLRKEHTELQACINSAYSRMHMADPEDASRAKK